MRLALIPLLFAFTASAADIIPDTRRVDWASEYAAGRIGATIIDRAVGSNLTGVVSTDLSFDNSAIINSALNLTPSNTAVLLPPGNILITNEITLINYKTLRGSGQSNTVLHCTVTDTNESMWWLRAIGVGNTDSTTDYTNNVVSGGDKGSTNLTMATMGGITNGAILLIDQLNYEYFTNGVAESYSYLSRDDGERLMGQMIQVLSVDGNDFTFSPPLAYWFTNQAQIVTYRTFKRGIGLENFMLTNAISAVGVNGVGEFTGGRNITFNVAENCWIKNVSLRNVVQYHVFFLHAFRCSMIDSDIYGAMQWISGRGYGIDVGYRSTACLVQNNWFELARPNIVISGMGPWNVFGYNYADGTYSDLGLIPDFLVNHGGAPFMGLWEGNVGNGLNTDLIHGGGNTQTIFRNYLRGWQPNASAAGTNDYQRAIAVLKGHWDFSVVGNVLGDPTLQNSIWTNYWTLNSDTNNSHNSRPFIFRLGFKGVGSSSDLWSIEVATNTLLSDNFAWSGDEGTNVFNPSGETLVDSYYLASKPSWFGSLEWPPIGPTMDDVLLINTRTNLIPAQLRFFGESSGGGGGEIPPYRTSANINGNVRVRGRVTIGP